MGTGKMCIILIGFLVALMLSGCSAQTGKNDFKQHISKIEQAVKEEDMTVLGTQIDQLLQIYDKNEWKLQLIGDEGEYERLHEAINRMITARKADDLTQLQLELATIKTIIEDIYSL